MSVSYKRIIWGWIMLMSWQALSAQKVLRVGIIKYKTEKEVRQSYVPLFTYVAKQLDVTLRYEIITDGSLAYRLNNGEFDIGVFTPFPYLEAKQDFEELEVFASHRVHDSTSYLGGIVVKKSSGIQSVTELKNKDFLFVKETSTSGFKYPEGIFREHGISLDSLASYDFSGGHFSSLMALLKENTAGAAINLEEMDQLDQEERDQLSILIRYEIPYHAYLFGPATDVDYRKRISDIMFDARKNPATKPLFQNPLNITSWYPQNDEAYNALRRYLSIVRVKPAVRLNLDVRERARKKLEEKGDIISVIQDKLEGTLMNSKRFSSIQTESGSNVSDVSVELFGIDDELYHYRVFLDDKKQAIGEGDANFTNLRTTLGVWVTQAVLRQIPIQTELLNSDDRWFITYGKNDGLDRESYEFILKLAGDDKGLTLSGDDILSMTEMSTDFKAQAEFANTRKMTIRYQLGSSDKALIGESISSDEKLDFFDNLDNVWGVIGLLVAVLTIGLGSFLTGRKKRRFRAMLYESNDLLRAYIEGKQRIDNRIMEQKEKINRSLEKGIIDENQFLILNHRLEDIDHVIQKYLAMQDAIPKQLAEELNDIMQDGTITEKEFSRIISLVKKNEN